MPLELEVLGQVEAPDYKAESKPKKIQAFIAALPGGDAMEAARLVNAELQLLNSQYFNVEERFAALELYRRAIQGIGQRLAQQYCNKPLPLTEAHLECAKAALELLNGLAYGYKRTLLDALAPKKFFSSRSKHIAWFIQGAIDVLGQMLLVCSRSYMPYPPNVWGELHQLYAYAYTENMQDEKIGSAVSAVSINNMYKRALLLGIADTSRLNTADLDKVIDYVERFAQKAILTPYVSTPQSPTTLFVVRAEVDAAPVSFAKVKPDSVSEGFLLSTSELVQQIQSHLSLPNGSDEKAMNQRYYNILVHLLQSWGKPPKRLFSRILKSDRIEVCVGIRAVHYFIQADITARAIMRGEVVPPQRRRTVLHVHAPWALVNESPGGMALSHTEAGNTVGVGDLIGIKAAEAQHWSLAVVRRAAAGVNNILNIGIQLLAPTATPVMIQPNEQAPQEEALLIPALPALKQPASLVTLDGIFVADQHLILTTGNQRQSIKMIARKEFSDHFERIVIGMD